MAPVRARPLRLFEMGDGADEDDLRRCRISQIHLSDHEIVARLSEDVRTPAKVVVPTPSQPPMLLCDRPVNLVSFSLPLSHLMMSAHLFFPNSGVF